MQAWMERVHRIRGVLAGKREDQPAARVAVSAPLRHIVHQAVDDNPSALGMPVLPHLLPCDRRQHGRARAAPAAAAA